MQIGVVADDLTGAADAVAPFAARGLDTGVGFELKSRIPRFRMDAGDILAYDTETRDLSPSPAAHIPATVRRAVRQLVEQGPALIYKKIDSTLRGHLRLELDAARRELPGRLALVCPAFPATGRTVQSGVLSIHGLPWTTTEFAPPYPLEMPTVRAAFGMTNEATAAELSGSDIRKGEDHLEAIFDTIRASGIETVFCDAADDAHLGVLTRVVLRRPSSYLPVGSAGWASVFASCLAPSPARRLAPDPLFRKERLLVVIGSRHRTSRLQREVLSSRLGRPPIVLNGSGKIREEVLRAADALWACYREGQRVAVLTTPEEPFADFADRSWASGSVVRALCRRAWGEGTPIRGLVLTGGKTAIDVCYQMNSSGLRIRGEIEPGVVSAALWGEADPVDRINFDGLPVITKAGGFGDAETLARCVGLPPG